MSITYSATRVYLTVAAVGSVVADDYFTAPSGAAGIVVKTVGTTMLVAFEMNATNVTPTETLTMADSGATASCTYRSTDVRDLTISTDNTNFAVGNVLTGATSGATGVLIKILDARSLIVAKTNGTAFAPTENITSPGKTTKSCTADVATTEEVCPANLVLVEGDESARTDIFRDIAAAASAGVTDPSATDYNLGLDMLVYIGRRGQSAATIAYSQNEMVDFTVSDNATLYVIRGTTNNSTLKLGTAKYLDNDYANFPPLYVDNGSKIQFDGSNSPQGSGLYVDGNIEFYDSQYIGPGVFYFAVNSTLYVANSIWKDMANYGTIYATWYANNWYVQGTTGEYFAIIPVGPGYAENLFFQNNTNSGIYAWLNNYEIVIKGFLNYDNNGVANKTTFANGGFGGGNILHFVNSDTDEDNISTTFLNDIECLYENSFKIKVVDELNNPIQNAVVQLKNAYGNALWTKLTATLNGAFDGTTDPVTVTFTDTSEFVAGDTIRIGCEIFTVSSVTNSTTAVLSGGKEGSTKHYHALTIAKVYKSGTALTNASGIVEYSGLGTYAGVPHSMVYQEYGGATVSFNTTAHKLTVRKPGYKDYKVPLTISGKNGKDLEVRLYSDRFIDQRSIDN